MSIDPNDLASVNGKDIFIESLAHPGHYLAPYGRGTAFEQPAACFRKPNPGEDMAAFRVTLYIVGTGVHLRHGGVGLRHHGWTGKFNNPPLVFYVGPGLTAGPGIVNINQGANPWHQVEYFTVEANRGYGTETMPLGLVMAYRTPPPTDDAGKIARSFRLHLADAWLGTPKGGDSVTFRNVATGEYIRLANDPRGGGSLECGDAPMKAAITWNHAERQPNNTTPAAPHAWTFDDQGDGTWMLRCGDQVCEVMPGMHLDWLKGTGNKVITRAPVATNPRQRWVIERT